MEVLNQATYQLVEKAKDSNNFEVDALHHYCLCMQVGIRDFQLCVIDTRTNTCVLLEDYLLKDVKTIKVRLQVLDHLFENHHLLRAGFWKSIKLSLKSHKFTLVPYSQFSADSAKDYLSVSCQWNEAVESEYIYTHKAIHVVNIFAGDKKLVRWVQSLYPQKNVELIHQGSALMAGVLKYQLAANGSKTVFAILERGVMHLFVSDHRQLYYYNQFAIKEAKELAKYILLVFKEFGLSQRSQKLILLGNISKSSDYFNLLSKYIGNISLGSRPESLHFNYYFDELAEQKYFDLFSIYLCE